MSDNQQSVPGTGVCSHFIMEEDQTSKTTQIEGIAKDSESKRNRLQPATVSDVGGYGLRGRQSKVAIKSC